MSIETLDYIINFSGHTVTCFEVGSVPTIGYASIEDAMTGTNPVIVPECIFEAACALLDQGVHLTAIYAHVGEETWMQWDEIPEELTAENIVAIEDEDSIRKQAVNRKQRRARRRVQNKRHKQSDRKHGKKRPMSRKDRVRAEDNRAQQERPIGMWRENCKGDYVFRPFQRTNRHNNYVSPEQDRFNALNVLGKNVTSEDIQWAKDVCVRAAYNNEYADEISDDLKWVLSHAETLEREIALVTVIKESWWHDEFEGIEICLPASKDCFASIEAKEYLPLCRKYDIGLVIAEYNPYR